MVNKVEDACPKLSKSTVVLEFLKHGHKRVLEKSSLVMSTKGIHTNPGTMPGMDMYTVPCAHAL